MDAATTTTAATVSRQARDHHNETGHGFKWISSLSAQCNRCPLLILASHAEVLAYVEARYGGWHD